MCVGGGVGWGMYGVWGALCFVLVLFLFFAVVFLLFVFVFVFFFSNSLTLSSVDRAYIVAVAY